MTLFHKIAGAASGIAITCAGVAAQADILFWSTQANPVEESQAMREQVLAGFDDAVDYQSNEVGAWLTRFNAELQANSGSIGLLGALHGNFSAMNPDDLVDVGDLGMMSASGTFNDLAKIGTDQMQYMPWMQASYIMAANKDALQYLPEGADIDALSYDELIAWAANAHEAAGEPKFGFPAGPKGLKHRFFQGYLYPSYTNGVVRTFASDEAVTAWEKFRELWEHTNPGSTNFSFMQEQLLSGDAWIVFDHTSRLAQAFNERPDDFVAFPAPAGPAGRGFMPVLAGIAIPRTTPDMEASKALVEYMLKPETQIATLRATNFFPVVDVELPGDLPPSVQAAGAAVAKMSGSADANPGLLPAGLGEKGGDFNRVFVDAFERIILARQDIRTVLDDQKTTLIEIMNETGAPCWAPDAPSEGACPVE
ncbi:ABC transporter substrate-binding protein [Marinovum sp. 2_MG-2023]|uniref:ABC transporter substrate-binding protein n=1 Tax=unclassified Marinovum TaxID=2647166 RepID=UPI0026E429D0|nr:MULTISPECIES: ABC transporter substrate-binding protein [unclassified Marinovum]MDO6730975.1 ABC transporter substrate-binding protein [Marinovum sp. 2_MG-2023]MDO6780202.1 ABC transporter substrate-binding protein [Marinovum sp. 1_MG-2023]